MSIPEIIGGIVMVLVSVGLIFLVLMQEAPKGGGMSALTGSDSYLNKNQGRSMDVILVRATKFLGIAFCVVTLIVYAIEIYVK